MSCMDDSSPQGELGIKVSRSSEESLYRRGWAGPYRTAGSCWEASMPLVFAADAVTAQGVQVAKTCHWLTMLTIRWARWVILAAPCKQITKPVSCTAVQTCQQVPRNPRTPMRKDNQKGVLSKTKKGEQNEGREEKVNRWWWQKTTSLEL